MSQRKGVPEIIHNLPFMPTDAKTAIRFITVLHALGLFKFDFRILTQGSFARLSTPILPLQETVDNKGKLLRQKTKPIDEKETVDKMNKDERMFAPAISAILIAQLFGRRDLAMSIASSTIIDYYFKPEGPLPHDKNRAKRQEHFSKFVQSTLRNLTNDIPPELQKELIELLTTAGQTRFRLTDNADRGKKNPKIVPASLRTLKATIADPSTRIEAKGFDGPFLISLFSGSESTIFDSISERELQKRRNIRTAAKISQNIVPLGTTAATLGGAEIAMFINSLNHGIEIPESALPHLIALIPALIAGLSTKVVGRKISNKIEDIVDLSEDDLPKAMEHGLQAISIRGGLLKYAFPAIIDLFERKVLGGKGNHLFDHQEESRRKLFENFGCSTLLSDKLTLNKIAQLTPSQARLDDDLKLVDSTLKREKTLLPLGEIMTQVAVIEWLREHTKRNSQNRISLPSESNFDSLFTLLGEDRLTAVKRTKQDPLTAVALAVPSAFRFAYPEFSADTLPANIKDGFDAMLFGSKAEDPTAGNVGNTGILPMVNFTFWKELRRKYPQSYMDKMVQALAQSTSESSISGMRNPMVEIIANPLLVQAFSTIAYFKLDTADRGGHGAIKHFIDAFRKSVLNDLENPEKFLLALNTLSALSFNIRMVDGFIKYYPSKKEVFMQSKANMQEAQRIIAKSMFDYYLKDKAQLVSDGINVQKGQPIAKGEITKQLTMFIVWLAKENPKLLNTFADDIATLYSRSGQIGEDQTPSAATFFSLYFVAKILKPEDGEVINSYDIPTNLTNEFFSASIQNLIVMAKDWLNTNLGKSKTITGDIKQNDLDNLNNAAKLIPLCGYVASGEQFKEIVQMISEEIKEEILFADVLFSPIGLNQTESPTIALNRLRVMKLLETAAESIQFLGSQSTLKDELVRNMKELSSKIGEKSIPQALLKVLNQLI